MCIKSSASAATGVYLRGLLSGLPVSYRLHELGSSCSCCCCPSGLQSGLLLLLQRLQQPCWLNAESLGPNSDEMAQALNSSQLASADELQQIGHPASEHSPKLLQSSQRSVTSSMALVCWCSARGCHTWLPSAAEAPGTISQCSTLQWAS